VGGVGDHIAEEASHRFDVISIGIAVVHANPSPTRQACPSVLSDEAAAPSRSSPSDRL
jgi:hypothetical protein